MVRTRSAILGIASFLLAAPLFGQSIERSALHDYAVVTVAEGLQTPWSIAFLPGGDMLVTERTGTLRIVRDGMLLTEPVAGTPEVVAEGQGGLLDVVLHPDFAENHLVYLSYSKPVGDESTTAVARGRLENDALVDVEDVFVADSQGR